MACPARLRWGRGRPVALCWHSDVLGLGLAYNFLVQPPNGAEYALLAAPQHLTSVTVDLLPVGQSTVRALAIDAR